MLGWILLIGGGWICSLNFYLSFLRYPLHRILGRSADSYRWVSGFPIVGSLAVVLAWAIWMRHHDSLALDITAWSLALLDTGGIHWAMISHRFDRRGKTSA